MLVRALALVLAVVLIGAAPQAIGATPDVAGEIDETPELAERIAPEAVAMLSPDAGGAAAVDAPRDDARGRAHTTLVFRPPRRSAAP